MTLLSFHNDPAIKEQYMKRVRAHAQADELIQGQYWKNGKGCAVGCTIHGNNHAAYETELGLPEWLARLEDTLFEGLTNADAKQFAVDFLEAIPVGVALDRVKRQFHVFLLQENLDRVQSLPLPPDLKQQILAAIQQVLTLHEQSLASGVPVTESVWRDAESAVWRAWRAAENAENAVWSARSARNAAESAARSARSDAESARSAGKAAWSDAESVAENAENAENARSAAYKRYVDQLLSLLREAR